MDSYNTSRRPASKDAKEQITTIATDPDYKEGNLEKNLELSKQLMKKYKKQIEIQFQISNNILDSISTEGLLQGWAFPKY